MVFRFSSQKCLTKIQKNLYIPKLFLIKNRGGYQKYIQCMYKFTKPTKTRTIEPP